ncbi:MULTISPECIES: CinA family protein [unclassified Microbacterium]|uniref:CinA family protein n=1 Tax=unclassified Microbacterium TaxID=2609290 RepID=UPI000D574198|nr:CinA family protein [Microbacterium sp. Gd 4-13]PVW04595.1 damage-inducible protein CinA [Microbacterium sp. Gd 4-13]
MIDGLPDDLESTLVRDPQESAARLIDRLAELGWSVAVAESLTGGLVVSSLVGVPGASRALRGGIVAYDSAIKQSLLGVDPTLLEAHGAVHPRVARQMAKGVRAALVVGGRPADVGIATTGIAGPESPDGQPVGTVHIAISTPLGTRVDSLELTGDREAIRQESARIAVRRALAAL